MGPGIRSHTVVRFGAFELRNDTGELRKHGIRIRLQGRPLQLLQALLERPGEVVTREELRDRLWAADTFVDFESGLNTAVNRLRLALGDSADHPRYIETLARSGYRFVGPVSELSATSLNDVAPAPVTLMPAAPAPPAPGPAVNGGPGPTPPLRGRSVHTRWIGVAVTLGLLLCAGLLIIVRRDPAAQPVFHQVTFRRLTIHSARFAPDGESVIYEGREQPGDRDLYLANMVSPESRALGFRRAMLAAVSHSGELALVSLENSQGGYPLVRVPVNGGAPLSLDRGVSAADWSPNGSDMAVIRNLSHPAVLEYPRGKVIYQSRGWMSHIRVSPSGREVAFIDHPVRADDAGAVTIIDAAGAPHVLSTGWASAQGLVWSPSGREIWFTAARTGVIRSLYGVSLCGKLRLIAGFPGTLTVHDVSQSGKVLVSCERTRAMMSTIDAGGNQKDLSWFDYSHAADMTGDGRVILFDETGEGGGANHAVYIRRMDSASATRVGDGMAMAISPDGSWAVTMTAADQTSLNLIPLTPGQSRTISGYGLRYDWARFFPDGNRLLVGGSKGGAPPRLYVQTLDGRAPEPVKTTTYLFHPVISPDGWQIAGVNSQQKLVVLPVAGGEPNVVPAKFVPTILKFASSGQSVLAQSDAVPAMIYAVDLKSGGYKLWKEVAPLDLAGVSACWPVLISDDERTLAYSFQRDLSDLFVVDGLR
ncbi:MAG: winged helix-turn-helix domain-containing protein [Bryobacteraceae bacterium]